MRRKRRVHVVHKKSNGWRFKHLTISVVGIIIAIILSQNEQLHAFLAHLGSLGYIGAFIAGILFVSTFTVATAALILLILAETLHPIEIGLIAGCGAVVGDITILRFVKDNLTNEISDIYNHVDRKKHLKKLFHSPYFAWMLPILGAIIIASPLPDEVGVSLIGISKMRTIPFMIISFILNSIGIFLIVSASLIIN
jgi:uncharacterized membrane protein YdjX (TVP38/TMEM64 family)